MRIGYDVFSKSRAENAITHVESVVEFRSIARHTDTITHAGKADPTKTPITVDYGSRTKHVSGFSIRADVKRCSPFR
jgi:hypothetical protein